MLSLEALFANGVRNPPASRIELEQLRSNFAQPLPQDYFELLRYSNGFEGFVGAAYLRLYSAENVMLLNVAYQFARFVPGLVLFGSNGGGQAFAFDTTLPAPQIVRLDFIPLRHGHAAPFGISMLEFLNRLCRWQPDGYQYKINPATFGMEVHEIHPVVLGGDPIDPDNKVFLAPEAHARVCVYWNNMYDLVVAEHQDKSIPRGSHDGKNL